MAASYSNLVTKLVAAIKVVKYALDCANGLSGNTNNFVALAAAANSAGAIDPDQNKALLAELAAIRASYELLLASEADLLTPIINDIALAIGSKATAVQDQITDLISYMNGNGDRVKTRTFTRGAFTGSPVGTGRVLRVTHDASGFALEASTPEVLTALVVADAAGGSSKLKASFPGQEVWQLSATPHEGYVGRGLTGRGSGWTGTFTGANGSDSLLKNPSLSSTPPGGDGTPTSIPNWDLNITLAGDGTDVIVDRTNYYQEFSGQKGNPGALRCKTQITLTQPFSGSSANVNRINPDNSAPYHDSVAFLPKVPAQTGAAGVLFHGPGSKRQAVVVQGMACAAADSGSAGNPNGAYKYVVTFTYTVDGGAAQESMYGAIATVTVVNHQVSLSSIPLGPAGTYDGHVYVITGRKIYRTTGGGSTLKLLATIADNTTSTFTDNVLDGSLGATVATANGDGWQLSMLEDAGSEANLWFSNWTTAGAGFTISWNPTAASGPLNLDRAMLVQYDLIPATIPVTSPASAAGTVKTTPYPSSFILFLSAAAGTPAGSGLPWRFGDTGTITDTEASPGTAGIVQDHFERAYQRCLPSAGAATGNWGDP